MSISLVPLSGLEAPVDSYVVFGGTFDPCHEGHVSVIQRLLALFPLVVLAPTAQNPWKTDAPTPLNERLEMLRLILAEENIPIARSMNGTGVYLSDYQYVYAEELVHALRSQKPEKLWWAAGEDTAGGVFRWRNWAALNVPTVVVPVTIEVHAEEIRRGEAPLHRAVQDYARQRGLYGGR